MKKTIQVPTKKWKLSNSTIAILKALGIKNLNDANLEEVLDMVNGEVIIRVPNKEEDERNQTDEQRKEIARFDAAFDDLNDHDEYLDYEWINKKLNEK